MAVQTQKTVLVAPNVDQKLNSISNFLDEIYHYSHNWCIFTNFFASNFSELFELEICMNMCKIMGIMDGQKV